MQTKEDLEKWYKKKEDPWFYQNNWDDYNRLMKIVNSCMLGHQFYETALDIGCGEGFITRLLPATKKYGYDLSEIAMSRLPETIIPLKEIEGKFELVVATGVLYKQYRFEWIIDKINETATKRIVTCNIKDWERGIDKIKGKQVFETEFPYKKYIQKLRIYEV